jgi:hypothetical protein
LHIGTLTSLGGSSVRNFSRAGAAILAAATLAFMPSAQAAERFTYDITAYGEGQGAGRSWGGFTFIDANSVHNIDQYLKDVCPGDGDAVYVELQFDSSKAGADGIYRAWKHHNSTGCGNTLSWTDQKWGDSWMETYDAGTIYRTRMKVCVEELDRDECVHSVWRDNPYSNDPDRTGG